MKTLANATTVAAGLVLALAVPATAAPQAHEAAEAFFSRYCVRCHDAGTQEGGFRLDTLAHDFGDMTVAERWAEVRTRIAAGEMPPQEEPRPSEAGRNSTGSAGVASARPRASARSASMYRDAASMRSQAPPPARSIASPAITAIITATTSTSISVNARAHLIAPPPRRIRRTARAPGTCPPGRLRATAPRPR